MKVKVFHSKYADVLEKEINEFIKDKQVIDIKYSLTPLSDKGLVGSCVILYEEAHYSSRVNYEQIIKGV